MEVQKITIDTNGQLRVPDGSELNARETTAHEKYVRERQGFRREVWIAAGLTPVVAGLLELAHSQPEYAFVIPILLPLLIARREIKALNFLRTFFQQNYHLPTPTTDQSQKGVE